MTGNITIVALAPENAKITVILDQDL